MTDGIIEEIDKARERGFIQGIVYTIATYIGIWGEHPWVEEIWRASGMSIELCEEMQVDEYDMQILKDNIEYINRISKK